MRLESLCGMPNEHMGEGGFLPASKMAHDEKLSTIKKQSNPTKYPFHI